MWGLELINSCPFSLLRTRPDCTRQAKLTRSGPRAQPGPFAGIGQNYERILYDNSQLARVYLHAWQVTGKAFYRTITEEILDYVIREMTDPKGGFCSTQDADSEGEEGKFFVWTPAGIREVLGADAEAFIAAYGVTERGNFEGKNILELVGSLEDRQALGAARKKLFEVREQRIHPARDEKVLPAQAAVSFRERRT